MEHQKRSCEIHGMIQTTSSRILGYVRGLGANAKLKDAPDNDLLEQFTAHHDETAFAMIVRRYGGMVQQVCQCLLRNRADADDAFQATFLVLARKASAIRMKTSLGSWLYGVAYRTALKAKIARSTRKRHETQARAQAQIEADELTWREAPLLTEEVLRSMTTSKIKLAMCGLVVVAALGFGLCQRQEPIVLTTNQMLPSRAREEAGLDRARVPASLRADQFTFHLRSLFTRKT
ncbi:MAG: sigma-70 family RNA polymerase sigma factor [Gemmataceae bacterium]|nr:sigma-70 family RNA polymerase sigma factor [Gemmataceae bacterium]